MRLPELKDVTDGITRAARDATYVVVGLGVLGFQRAQVRRQELQRRLSDPREKFEGRLSDVQGRLSEVQGRLNEARGELAKPIQVIDDTIEQVIGRVEASFEPIEERLPAQAREIVEQVRSYSRDARQQIRSIVRNATSPSETQNPRTKAA